MAIDFRDYNDPGVYVEIVDNPVTTSPGVEPTIVAFIGESPNSVETSEAFTVRAIGTTLLTEEGVLPETVSVADSRGENTFTSGLLAKFTSELNFDGSEILSAQIEKYADYLYNGTYAVAIGAETGYTLTVSGAAVDGGGYVDVSSVVWTLTGPNLLIPDGSAINLATTWTAPTFYVGQTLSPLSADNMYDEPTVAQTALFPAIDPEDLSVVTFDQEIGKIFRIESGPAGNWTITLGGQQTANIANNASAATIQAALEALTNVEVGDVVATGGPINSTDVDIRLIGSWLPTGNTAAKDALRTTVNDLTVTGATLTETGAPLQNAADTDAVAPGDVLEVGGERWQVLGELPTTVTVADYGVCKSFLVQRGFQGTVAPASQHNIHTKIYKVEALDADYMITIDAGFDEDITSLEDNQVNIVTVDDGVTDPRLTVGLSCLATMRVTDATFFSPRHYTKDVDVYEDYGTPLKSKSYEINSEVSLAAQLAFANGANEIVIVAVNPNEKDVNGDPLSTIGTWTAAVDKLDSEPTVNTIVPLIDTYAGTGLTVASYIRDKNNAIIADGILRRSFFGFDSLLNYYTAADFKQLATEWRDYRVSLVSPGYAYIANQTSRDSKIPGYFIAAAVASRQASLPPQEPLTRKQIYGFTAIEPLGFADTLDMQAAGVLVVWQDRLGRMLVKHGLTTDMTSSYTREISVVTARDRLRDLIYTTLDDGELIGSAMTARTPDLVMAGVTGALEEATRLSLIYSYGDIQYRIDPIEPTAIEVRFAYKPTLPLNYIVVQFSIDTSLGTLDFQTVSQSTQ